MDHKIVSKEEWAVERKKLLDKEKEFTRLRDELSVLKRQLPWVKIEKDYTFDSKYGSLKLSDLFDGRSQLIVYHFMFGPEWEEGCKSCSFWADNFNDIAIHLQHRDVTLLCISNGPKEKFLAFQKRMGWTFPWVSSLNSDFNSDFHVSNREGEELEYNFMKLPAGPARELPGVSVFYKNEQGEVFHTYSSYARGLEDFNTAYRYLDVVPKGRDEESLPYGMDWVKLRDRYDANKIDSIDIL